MKKSFWLIAPFCLCLALHVMPVHAGSLKEDGESTMDRWERERKEQKESDYCSGYNCSKQDKDDTDHATTPQLENSFRQQGTKNGSIGGIVAGQLQPR